MLEAYNSAAIPAGYDPTCFIDNDLDDAPAISPHLAQPARSVFPGIDDAEVEELEDEALADGRTIAELEQQALNDELQAVALEIALSTIKETMSDMLDPTTRLVPCARLPDGVAPACTYMRLAFRRGALQSAIRRLQRRAKMLRRAADRQMREEARKYVSPSGNAAMVA
jgi:hypothetical protein